MQWLRRTATGLLCPKNDVGLEFTLELNERGIFQVFERQGGADATAIPYSASPSNTILGKKSEGAEIF